MNGERFTLDSNVLFYYADDDAGERHMRALEIVERAAVTGCHLTLQAVSELYAAITRKRVIPPAQAAAVARDFLTAFPTIAPTVNAVRTALATAAAGRSSYWDALLVATAAEGGCTAVLTEDLAGGGVLLGVRVINPFVGDALPAEVETLLSQP